MVGMSSGSADATRCLLVQCAGQVCALPLARVRRVVRALQVSPLPGGAPELLGLAEFGGEPLPVLDLARLLGAGPSGATAHAVTVVAFAGPRDAAELLGLAADAALDIVEIPAVAPLAGGPALIASEVVVAGRPVRVLQLSTLGATS